MCRGVQSLAMLSRIRASASFAVLFDARRRLIATKVRDNESRTNESIGYCAWHVRPRGLVTRNRAPPAVGFRRR